MVIFLHMFIGNAFLIGYNLSTLIPGLFRNVLIQCQINIASDTTVDLNTQTG